MLGTVCPQKLGGSEGSAATFALQKSSNHLLYTSNGMQYKFDHANQQPHACTVRPIAAGSSKYNSGIWYVCNLLTLHARVGTMCRGTLPYMAPELVSDPERVSEKADVWSLGMVLWEMLTRQVPFTHLTPQQIIAGLMVGNLQPEVQPRLHTKCLRCDHKLSFCTPCQVLLGRC